MDGKILTLAGGVGGSKLVLGLANIIDKNNLQIIVNTGDDDLFHGLHVSPDLDTVMYTLAGLANPETGWGMAHETFNLLDMLKRYQAETWFNLGDHDLATHIRRTQLLREGKSLSEVTLELCSSIGIGCQIAPMSDQKVTTVLETSSGTLRMQEYFVKHQCQPIVNKVEYVGSETAEPSRAFDESLNGAMATIFCPSNPFLSLGPILSIPTVKHKLSNLKNRIAVSPIIGGKAIRGPASKLMTELGYESSAAQVAYQYKGICDVFIIAEEDVHLSPVILEMGIEPLVGPILMNTLEDKINLAEFIVSQFND